MAQIISATGAEGLEIYTPNSKELIFGTNANERMRITSGGNVAIGSTNADPLSLSRDRNLAIVTTGTNAALTIVGGGAARIDFGVGSTRTGGIYMDSTNFMEIFTSTALPIVFSPNATQAMRITSGGQVGINQTSPMAMLQVKKCSENIPTAQFDSWGFQEFALNNSWLAYNVCYCSDFYHRCTGGGVMMYIDSDNVNFRVAASNTAGSTFTYKKGLQVMFSSGVTCTPYGIKFGGGSSILNNYDEATSFTPCLYFQGSVTGLSYATRSAYYTRIGNTVFATMYIQWCKASSATDNIGVYLPITSMNNGTPAIGNFYSGNPISETRPIQVYVAANSTISILLTQDGQGNLANCFANSTLHYWMVTMQYMV
jgi:hypothetical protein